MTSVDVIVPCYNYARYLRDCVDSVLSQEGVAVRVLIIDDCSDDDTPAIGQSLANDDSRVTFRRHAVNLKHIATYNEGFDWASADLVVLLSADDQLAAGSLARAAAVFERHPEVGLVYGYPVCFDTPSPPVARTRTTGYRVWSGRSWIRRMCATGRNFITCPEAVMRTSVQKRIGGYRAALPHSADMDVWMRAASMSDVARIHGADQAFYRVHSLSMQRTVFAAAVKDLDGRYRAFESALLDPTAPIPFASAQLSMARRALCREALSRALLATTSMSDPTAMVETVDSLHGWVRTHDAEEANSRAWRSLLTYTTHRPQRQPPGLLARTLAEQWVRRLQWYRWRLTGVF